LSLFLFGYFAIKSKGSRNLGDMTYIGITVFGFYLFTFFK